MLRRGFKSQCERRAVELRKQLGLRAVAPLPARSVAERFGVTVWSVDDIADLSEEDRNQLTIVDADSWSAFTLRMGNRDLVLFNPAQNERRVNSVIMHELAHILLGHRLAAVGTTAEGHLIPSNYDQDQEDEANWLAGTLLLPRPALIAIRRSRLSDEVAASRYLVSGKMLAWRFRMTGVDYQIAAARQYSRTA